MKIFIFTDTHGSSSIHKELKDTIKKEDPDILICLGDFTVFGEDQKKILKQFNKFKKPMLLIHGNHEYDYEVAEDVEDLENIDFVHDRLVRLDNILFVPFGGGGFSLTEPGFRLIREEYKMDVKKDDIVILLTHAPPYKTNLDKIEDSDCGCKTYKNFIKKYKPAYAFSGHLHENNGVEDKVGKTIVMNPGPHGKIIEV